MPKIIYGDWFIDENPKPIPTTKFDWDYVHKDYDGPEDSRCGATDSIESCKRLIDEFEFEEDM